MLDAIKTKIMRFLSIVIEEDASREVFDVILANNFPFLYLY